MRSGTKIHMASNGAKFDIIIQLKQESTSLCCQSLWDWLTVCPPIIRKDWFKLNEPLTRFGIIMCTFAQAFEIEELTSFYFTWMEFSWIGRVQNYFMMKFLSEVFAMPRIAKVIISGTHKSQIQISLERLFVSKPKNLPGRWRYKLVVVSATRTWEKAFRYDQRWRTSLPLNSDIASVLLCTLRVPNNHHAGMICINLLATSVAGIRLLKNHLVFATVLVLQIYLWPADFPFLQ